MSQTDAYTDVVELCALLQCLGFSVKSQESCDAHVSQEGEPKKTVVINCQVSGLTVVLESGNQTCSCPSAADQQSSSIWQVSGMTRGIQLSKEYGSGLIGSLPKPHRDRVTRELRDIVRSMKVHSDFDADGSVPASRSASLLEMSTPEKRHMMLKADSPSRCRSLDALTFPAKDAAIPEAGLMLKSAEPGDCKKRMCQRQSTYTIGSSSRAVRTRNKTSSPIRDQLSSHFERLIEAEKLVGELQQKLSTMIQEYAEDDKYRSSLSPLPLDVSKISLLKADAPKLQFSSSPNLTGMGLHEDKARTLKRTDSASTSKLVRGQEKEGKMSKLRRLSPSLFKSKPAAAKTENTQDKSTKLNSLSVSKPRIVTPVRIQKSSPERIPNISTVMRKKFSHVKSTIPRPASRKE